MDDVVNLVAVAEATKSETDADMEFDVGESGMSTTCAGLTKVVCARDTTSPRLSSDGTYFPKCKHGFSEDFTLSTFFFAW